MTDSSAQLQLKKDFHQAQELLITNEAYDFYNALKTAQTAFVHYSKDHVDFCTITTGLEQLREYFFTILLLEQLEIQHKL